MLDFSELFISQPATLIFLNVSVPTKILLLLFNGQIFYTLSNVLKYICDYLKSEERVYLYLDIVKQASNIFDLGLAFVAGLIKAVKKDKSLAIEKWLKHEFEKLIALFSRYVKADRIRKTCHNKALKTIIKH